ncbi:unnamed protein product [Aphanomyces euteiches]|uniref:Uncharacterized protein n=1 Tax=Aphanomyces euteiches TaxID=100861 RepID=A0A6G0WY94_9STRA|nr:hypothetical protein Ae201684_010412 [Aphanomyces euteiches]KAH9090084.1 hypothetical protein Ae201684P_014838 [Aphanomyces euteiches]KAH9132332.1 hypothetical protein AeRB84_021235 [Aphanomyces euteiches]
MTVTSGDNDAIHVCVQCGRDFAEKDNVQGACDYHPAITYKYHSWSCELSCCGKSLSSFEAFPADGCARSAHSRTHHERFPYINRLGQFRTILSGSDKWMTVEQQDVTIAKDGSDIGCPVAGHVGVLRDGTTVVVWAAQDGTTIDLKVINTVEGDEETLLQVDESTTLIDDSWGKLVKSNGAHWFVRIDRVKGSTPGLRVEVKSASGAEPNSKLLQVDGDGNQSILVLQDDEKSIGDIQPPPGFHYEPSLPQSSFQPIPCHVFDPVTELPEFQSTGDLPLRVKCTKPVVANDDFRPFKSDLFTVRLMLVDTTSPIAHASSEERKLILIMVRDHKISVDDAERLLLATANHATATATSSGTTSQAITIVDVRAKLSLDNGATWIPADNVTLNGADDILYQVSGIDKVSLNCRFPAPDKQGQWSRQSYLTRLASEPALLQVSFESALGPTAQLQVAYANPPLSRLPERNASSDLFFLHVDNVREFSRSYVKVTRPSTENETPRVLFAIHVSHDGSTTTYEITPRHIRTWLAQQRRLGPAEMPLDNLSQANRVEWTAVFSNSVDKDNAGLVALRVKLFDGGDANLWAQDTWVIDYALLC